MDILFATKEGNVIFQAISQADYITCCLLTKCAGFRAVSEVLRETITRERCQKNNQVKMPMQNRLNPFGDIIETNARGAWMGNRGVLHNRNKEIIKPFTLHTWITCVLQFRNRKRTIMTPGHYTELFSLDEATAFAAGHRPCAECSRADFNWFKTCWIKANPQHCFNHKTPIADIDAVLHAERIGAGEKKITYQEEMEALPDGSFILDNLSAWLIHKGLVFEWSPYGYKNPLKFPGNQVVTVLTPRSVVRAFREGYLPQIAM